MAPASHLKYIYGALTPETEGAELTPETLAALPEVLCEELRAALENLDSARISAGIDKASTADAHLGHILTQLAENFDYPAILRALEGN